MELALKGLGKVQEDLKKAKASVEDLVKSAEKIGSTGAKVFFGTAAAIGKFVQTADPKGFEDFQVALYSLQIQLGRMFVPLLRETTQRIQQLVKWFKSLSDDTREQVLHWTKVTLVASGFLAVLPRIISIASSVGTAFKAVQGAMALLTANPIVAVIAAIIGLFAATEQGRAVLGKVFTLLADTFGKVMEALQPLLTTLAEVFGEIVDAISPLFEIVSSLLDMLQPFIEIMAGLFKAVAGAIKVVMELLKPLLALIKTIFGIFAALFSSLSSASGSAGSAAGSAYFVGLVMEIRAGKKTVQDAMMEIQNDSVTKFATMGKKELDELKARAKTAKFKEEFSGEDSTVASRLRLTMQGAKVSDEDIFKFYVKEQQDRLRAALNAANKVGGKGDPNKFRGEVRQQGAGQYTDLLGAFKKLQAGAVETPEARRQREQLDQAKKQTKIAEDVKKGIEDIANKVGDTLGRILFGH